MLMLLLLVFGTTFVYGKVYSKCELTTELLGKGISGSEVYKWVCMAEYESSFDTSNTSSVGNIHNSTDYGIFMINDYWDCDPQNGGTPKNGCGHPCSDYEDSDISDDIVCIKHIVQKDHGFNFSDGYKANCQGKTSSSYLGDCSDSRIVG